MSLTRDKIVGHDTERLAFKFTMLNEGKVVPCQISDAAMDELGGTAGTENSARQAQFVSLRDEIEAIVSDLFARSPRVEGYVIRIFTKHVKERASAAVAHKAEAAETPSLPPPDHEASPDGGAASVAEGAASVAEVAASVTEASNSVAEVAEVEKQIECGLPTESAA
jgi:Protein of unknown function (DUF1488)